MENNKKNKVNQTIEKKKSISKKHGKKKNENIIYTTKRYTIKNISYDNYNNKIKDGFLFNGKYHTIKRYTGFMIKEEYTGKCTIKFNTGACFNGMLKFGNIISGNFIYKNIIYEISYECYKKIDEKNLTKKFENVIKNLKEFKKESVSDEEQDFTSWHYIIKFKNTYGNKFIYYFQTMEEFGKKFIAKNMISFTSPNFAEQIFKVIYNNNITHKIIVYHYNRKFIIFKNNEHIQDIESCDEKTVILSPIVTDTHFTITEHIFGKHIMINKHALNITKLVQEGGIPEYVANTYLESINITQLNQENNDRIQQEQQQTKNIIPDKQNKSNKEKQKIIQVNQINKTGEKKNIQQVGSTGKKK